MNRDTSLIIIKMDQDPKEIADEIRRELMNLIDPEPPELPPQTSDAITLESFSTNTSDYTKLSCGHIFYSTFIIQWLQNKYTCPLCRQRVKISKHKVRSVFKFDSIDDLEEVQKIAKVTPEVTSDKTYYIVELTENARVKLRQKGLQIVFKNDSLSLVRPQESSAKKAKIQILMDQDIVNDVRLALGDVVKQDSDKYYTNELEDPEKYYLQASDTNKLRDSLLEKGLRIISRARVKVSGESENFYMLQEYTEELRDSLEEKGLRIISTDNIFYIVRINTDTTPAFLGLKLRF